LATQDFMPVRHITSAELSKILFIMKWFLGKQHTLLVYSQVGIALNGMHNEAIGLVANDLWSMEYGQMILFFVL
jgi:hypothetical protein